MNKTIQPFLLIVTAIIGFSSGVLFEGNIRIFDRWNSQRELRHYMEGYVGKKFTLSEDIKDIHGNPVEDTSKYQLFHFWSLSCGYCLEEWPQLEILDREKSLDVQVIAVNSFEEPYEILEFVEEMDVSFPVVFDIDKSLYQSFEGRFVPLSFLLDQNHKVLSVHQYSDNLTEDIAKVIERHR